MSYKEGKGHKRKLMNKLNLLLLTLVFVTTGCVVGEVQAPKSESGATIGPSLSSITPTGGPLSGSTAVTLTGNGFSSGMLISIGGIACSPVTVTSTTTATCNTGTSFTAGARNVTVTRNDGESATLFGGYTYRPAPTVASILPIRGSTVGSDLITISGTGFLSGATVSVGPYPCAVQSVAGDGTSLTCLTGSSGGTVITAAATVTNPDTQVGSGGSYTYNRPPNPTSVDIIGGPTGGGTTIVITGTDFTDPVDRVQINGVNCALTGTDTTTSIQCITGDNSVAGAGTYDVVVRNATTLLEGTLSNGFTYQDAPNATGVSPNGWTPASTRLVTITGSGFDVNDDMTVTFTDSGAGTVSCTGLTNFNPTSFQCTLQTGAALGAATITVRNNTGGAQADTTPVAFTFRNPPTITTVATINGPNNTVAGALSGGTILQIDGSDFLLTPTLPTIEVDGEPCNIVSSPLPAVAPTTTRIFCSTPARATPGTVDVTLENNDTQIDTATGAFTYQNAPSITSVSPNGGDPTTPALITIDGDNFDVSNSATVEIGSGNSCTGVTVSDANTITCTPPAGTNGQIRDVIVTNLDGSRQTTTASSAYTYQLPPNIVSVSPDAGPLTSAGTLVITGTSFRANATVTVGGNPCPVTDESGLPSSIECTIPDNVAAGPEDVVVTNEDDQADTFSSFTYQLSPLLSGVTPDAGAISGGYNVVINGNNFVSGARGFINNEECTLSTVLTPTTLQCQVPGDPAGTYAVRVVNNDGQEVTLSNAFRYQGPPVISELDPPGGDLAGSTNLIIRGNFETSNGVQSVLIGTTACPVVSNTALEIECDVPVQPAGPYSVTVTMADGGNQTAVASQNYIYAVAPTIDPGGVSPAGGSSAGGTTVTITGTNFQDGARVEIDGTVCEGPGGTVTAEFVNATTLRCTTRAAAASATARDVTVTNPDNQADTLNTAYTYSNPPVITGVETTLGNPPRNNGREAAGGAAVRINGVNFLTGSQVFFDGVECLAYDYSAIPNRITCTNKPAGTGAADVRLLGPDGQEVTLTDGFNYLPAPTVTSITPGFGPASGGTAVTITGTNFDPVRGATVVELNGVACTSVNVVDSNTITCTSGVAGGGGAGGVRVVNNNSDQLEGTLGASWSYVAAPTISTITPINNGPAAGGTTIDINGTGFLPGGTTVTIGGSVCSINTINSTDINCTTGPVTISSPQTYDVVVTLFDGQNTAATNFWTYNPPPQITTPATIPKGGAGASFTISGQYFVDPTPSDPTITVGGTPCTATAFINSTTLSCTVPAGALGPADVVVQNPDLQTATLSGGFEYVGPPVVSSVNPNVIDRTVTTPITVTGSGFTDVNTLPVVTLDPGGTNTACTGVSVSSDGTTITCTAQTRVSTGSVDVRVVNGDFTTQNGTGSGILNYQNPPTIDPLPGGLVPGTGPQSGGNTVTINGSGFIDPPTPRIFFGASECPTANVNVVSATQIQCTDTPAGTGTVPVTVRTFNAITSNSQNYTYDLPPSIDPLPGGLSTTEGSDFTPTSLTISGSDFNLTPDANSVRIGGISCTVTADSATSITCDVGDGSALVGTPQDVVVTNADGQSATLSAAFTYLAAPTIGSVTPASGADNTSQEITIDGTGFVSGTTVTIGGAACNPINSQTATEIRCDSPTNIVTGTDQVDVVVLNPDGQSATAVDAYEAQEVPNISGFSPTNGDVSGGTSVTISGTNLENLGTITIGGFSPASVTYTSTNSVTIVTPDVSSLPGSPPYVVSVTYQNPNGRQTTASSNYTFNPSAAELQWQTGVTSNPEDFGTTTSNVSRTFTLENVGSAASNPITISLSGTNTGAFFISADTCSTTTLLGGATCTVDVVFLGAILAPGAYSANLDATDGTTSSSNGLQGAR